MLNILLLSITAAIAGYCFHQCCFVLESENIVGYKLIGFNIINSLFKNNSIVFTGKICISIIKHLTI